MRLLTFLVRLCNVSWFQCTRYAPYLSSDHAVDAIRSHYNITRVVVAISGKNLGFMTVNLNFYDFLGRLDFALVFEVVVQNFQDHLAVDENDGVSVSDMALAKSIPVEEADLPLFQMIKDIVISV